MKQFGWIVKKIRKPAQSIIDPVFGVMTFEKGSWVAYTDFPHARGPVEVSVWGKETPSAFQQAVMQTLIRGYAQLEPLIENALFEEYKTAQTSGDAMDVDGHFLTGEYLPKKAGEVWKTAHPVSIDIYPAGYSSEYDCRIYCAFPVDREHNRSVFLRNGKLVSVLPE